MDNIEFIEVIKLVVEKSSINSVVENLKKPPGRSPSVHLLELSQWYNNLSESDRSFVYKVISESVSTSIFGFLCVLDGVRAIENGKKGELKLYYEKDDLKILLNDFNSEFLHDIFNSAE